MPTEAAGGTFSAADLEQLRERGLGVEEARRQIELLLAPPRYAALDRPCALGDGIKSVGEAEGLELAALHAQAANAGRCLLFVPASGAATRMFRELVGYRERPGELPAAELEAEVRAGRAEARATRAFFEGLRRFAFARELERAVARSGGDLDRLAREGPYRPILDALLTERGLGYSDLPKGLIPFHAYGGQSRTPFEEHLVESLELVRDERGTCRLHLTVSPDHQTRFQALLARTRADLEARLGARFQVEFSAQKPSTDALSVDLEGRPFRDPQGRLLFRPAGHGALLENLNDLDADIVLIKNIDNVASDHFKHATYAWSKVVIGDLVRIQDRVSGLLRRLEDPADLAVVTEAAGFARDTLGRPAPAAGPAAPEAGRREQLAELLRRPLRVCGMVANTGEPGGGPFWVRGRDGELSRQIVETAEVDPGSAEQRAILARSTHFNPVFMACGLRDHRGVAFDLRRYVDDDAVIVTRKSSGGRDLKVLERPGLWNGAMAGWNTVFIEVPLEVFNPVKTLNDLLRKEHQPEA